MYFQELVLASYLVDMALDFEVEIAEDFVHDATHIAPAAGVPRIGAVDNIVVVVDSDR